jgi:hypothetical protein
MILPIKHGDFPPQTGSLPEGTQKTDGMFMIVPG